MASNSLIFRVLGSLFYKKAFGKASRLTKNSAGILGLLKDVLLKSGSVGPKGMADKVGYKFTTLINLVKAYAKGEYRDVSTRSIISIIAAFIYFISPIDVLPDFIPLLGFADDIALLSYVISTIRGELEKFELWALNNDLEK